MKQYLEQIKTTEQALSKHQEELNYLKNVQSKVVKEHKGQTEVFSKIEELKNIEESIKNKKSAVKETEIKSKEMSEELQSNQNKIIALEKEYRALCQIVCKRS
jgi:erythromycin esterase-like protein